MRKGKEGKEEVGSICKGNGSGGDVYPSFNRGILLKAAPQLIMLLKRDAQRLYGRLSENGGGERSSHQLRGGIQLKGAKSYFSATSW